METGPEEGVCRLDISCVQHGVVGVAAVGAGTRSGLSIVSVPSRGSQAATATPAPIVLKPSGKRAATEEGGVASRLGGVAEGGAASGCAKGVGACTLACGDVAIARRAAHALKSSQRVEMSRGSIASCIASASFASSNLRSSRTLRNVTIGWGAALGSSSAEGSGPSGLPALCPLPTTAFEGGGGGASDAAGAGEKAGGWPIGGVGMGGGVGTAEASEAGGLAPGRPGPLVRLPGPNLALLSQPSALGPPLHTSSPSPSPSDNCDARSRK